MSTIGDYTSLVEIGFALNLATSYVNIFVNPSLSKSRSEIERYKWWVDHPVEAKKVLNPKFGPEECEDRFVRWRRSYDKLEKKVTRSGRYPAGFAIAAAIISFGLLTVPSVPVDVSGIVAIVFLAVGPLALGSAYVWKSSEEQRKQERLMSEKAHQIFV